MSSPPLIVRGHLNELGDGELLIIASEADCELLNRGWRFTRPRRRPPSTRRRWHLLARLTSHLERTQ